MKRKQKSQDVELNQLMEAFLRPPVSVPQNSRALLLPYSVGLGAGAVMILSYTYPDPILCIGAGLIGLMTPTTVYGAVRGIERILDSVNVLLENRMEMKVAKLEIESKERTEALRLAHEKQLKEMELRSHHLSLNIQRAQIHLQIVEAELRTRQMELRLNTPIMNGLIRQSDPDKALKIDMERAKWTTILNDIYSKDRSVKTEGQPFTQKLLGAEKFDLLRTHKLIYLKGKHPQWNFAEFADVNDALRVMEEIGFFEV